MKKLLNRALSIVLAVTMCAGLLSLSAFAANVGDECPNSRTYGGNGSHSWYQGICMYCQASQSGSSDPVNPDETGNICPECGKETYVLVDGDDYYCNQDYCLSCNYQPKPTHYFGPKGDSEACTNGCGYKNPNWKPLPEGVIQAKCGGTYKYDPVNNLAIVISKGTTCVDVNIHDHECDFCHAEMLDTKWVVDEVATCEHGGKEHEECVYAGCTIRENYGVKTTNPLDPVFPDTWTMVDNLQHYHNCVNCNGVAEDHVDYEAHHMTEWGEWEQINKDACPADKLPADFNADTHTLWARVKHCEKCEYAEYQYEAREKEPEEHTLTIYYRYVDNNGEVMGDNGQVATPYVGTFKEGEDFSVGSPAAPAGYAREAGMDTVTGKMGTGDEVRTVKYEIINYTWTINYVDENGKPMDGMQTVTKTFTVNSIEDLTAVTSPTKEGYTADTTVVNAPTKLGDVTDTVTYKLSAIYKLTVNHQYVAQNGTRTVVTQVIGNNYKMGDSYTTSPAARNGYTLSATPDNAKGVFEAKDVTVTYVYAETTQPTQPEVEDNDPDPTPEPPVNIDEPEVPLTGDPEVDIEEPDVDIEEPDVPLAEEPEVDIEEPDVPLAEVPETGDKFLLWGGLTLISGAGLTLLTLMDKKRKDDEA